MDKHEAEHSEADKQDLEAIKDEILEHSAKDLDALMDDKAEESAQVKQLEQERDEFEDKYLRAAAEVKNIGMRNKKEREQLLHYDGQKVITSILPVLDNLERALEAEVTDEGAVQLKKGVQMVSDHLAQALKDAHVTEVGEVGAKFDPTVHQAVQTVAADAEHEKDTVVTVFQKGYKLHDRVLRPAMVVVAN